MIEDTIRKLESMIAGSESMGDDRKRELSELLDRLRVEITTLSRTHEDEARSIAGFAELSAHEATKSRQNPELLSISLKGLSSSVSGFEESHPRLVQAVNAISHTLANLGI
jgi:hypothetical protein